MYQLMIDNRVAEQFMAFEPLIEFLIRFAHPCDLVMDRNRLACLEINKMLGEYRTVRFEHGGFRHRFLEEYNRTGKDMDEEGNLKRFCVIHNGAIVSPDALWDGILQKKQMVCRATCSAGNRA